MKYICENHSACQRISISAHSFLRFTQLRDMAQPIGGCHRLWYSFRHAGGVQWYHSDEWTKKEQQKSVEVICHLAFLPSACSILLATTPSPNLKPLNRRLQVANTKSNSIAFENIHHVLMNTKLH